LENEQATKVEESNVCLDNRIFKEDQKQKLLVKAIEQFNETLDPSRIEPFFFLTIDKTKNFAIKYCSPSKEGDEITTIRDYDKNLLSMIVSSDDGKHLCFFEKDDTDRILLKVMELENRRPVKERLVCHIESKGVMWPAFHPNGKIIYFALLGVDLRPIGLDIYYADITSPPLPKTQENLGPIPSVLWYAYGVP